MPLFKKKMWKCINMKIINILLITIVSQILIFSGCINNKDSSMNVLDEENENAYYNYEISVDDFSNYTLIIANIKVVNNDIDEGINSSHAWWLLKINDTEYTVFDHGDYKISNILPNNEFVFKISFRVPKINSGEYLIKYCKPIINGSLIYNNNIQIE